MFQRRRRSRQKLRDGWRSIWFGTADVFSAPLRGIRRTDKISFARDHHSLPSSSFLHARTIYPKGIGVLGRKKLLLLQESLHFLILLYERRSNRRDKFSKFECRRSESRRRRRKRTRRSRKRQKQPWRTRPWRKRTTQQQISFFFYLG